MRNRDDANITRMLLPAAVAGKNLAKGRFTGTAVLPIAMRIVSRLIVVVIRIMARLVLINTPTTVVTTSTMRPAV